MPARTCSPPKSPSSSSQSNPQVQTPLTVQTLVSQANATLTADPQTQMTLMLTETFSKLTTTLLEKKDDSKYDWPKFSSDPKKFRPWYMAIITQISLPSWKDLCDPATNDVRKSTMNTLLNAKLYAKKASFLGNTLGQMDYYYSKISSKHINQSKFPR